MLPGANGHAARWHGPRAWRPYGAMGPAGTAPTPSGLERDRYILSNEQCRHLPVAMVLEVDQAAINDILIAVANSPLHIQITQVSALHVHDSGPASTDGSTGDTIVGGGPVAAAPVPKACRLVPSADRPCRREAPLPRPAARATLVPQARPATKLQKTTTCSS